MKKTFVIPTVLLAALAWGARAQEPYSLFPANGAREVNPDTHLFITLGEKPAPGTSGFIRIFDAQSGRQVDALDLSIPAGPEQADMVRKQQAVYTPSPYTYQTTGATNANTVPGTPSGLAVRDTSNYQLTIIGGFTDAFRFHPIIVKGNTAEIYPHHNLLEYGKEYYVTVDAAALKTDSVPFGGIDSRRWTFRTKSAPPAPALRRLVVNNDGSGDFNTVQGAMDFIPEFSKERWEVYICNGDYEELVYFRNKSNVTLRGESRDGVVIHYANNETFNPHPVNLKTNEWPGTFPSRRAAFAADNCTDMRFENLTIKTTLYGQAEGLLIMGERNFLKNVVIVGSGDALQVNGSAYFENCVIDGAGDTILGRGPCFFANCTLKSGGPFMWIRNTEANHGNIFVDCTFLGGRPGRSTQIARAPRNNGAGYPYAEAVLIDCRLDGISPEGWGAIGGDGANNRFWEFNSRTLSGAPVDVSRRHPLSHQLDAEKDAEHLRNYRNPAWVLGWDPQP
jgi:pectin methylesterase-like acyl-CoA thioesterase